MNEKTKEILMLFFEIFLVVLGIYFAKSACICGEQTYQNFNPVLGLVIATTICFLRVLFFMFWEKLEEKNKKKGETR